MTPLLETLASYVPPLIARRLADDPAPPTKPSAERFPAAVLFADISGFTALTERLAQRGPVGAEELTRLLNVYFGHMIDLISAHGGEVVKFAGDALLALWPATEYDLSNATLRAAQCGLAVQARLNDYKVADGVRLSLRVGIGSGDVFTAHVGGMRGRWEFLVAGAPLVQMGIAEQQAHPSAVVLSPEAWTLAQEQCMGDQLSEGCILLKALRDPLPLCPLAPFTPNPDSEEALRAYIPGAILSRLDAGQTEWLAELRRLTVLFVNVTGLDYAAPNALDQVQTVMHVLQTDLYHYEGSINKLVVDDKGTTLIAVLGLPPFTHEDDAVRGVQAALAIQAELRQLKVRSAIGIATGQAFCGPIGSAMRREYTLIGDIANLAARLMQAATEGVLCDAATYQRAQVRVTFDALPPLSLKGKSSPVPVYRPCGQAKVTRSPRPMIGRTAERQALAGRLKALREGTGGFVLIEGEPGIGKSRLVDDLLQQAKAYGVKILTGAGDAIERGTPYHGWRPAFLQYFQIEAITDPETQRTQVLTHLQSEPELLRLAPLLNTVLPLDLPENEITVQLAGQVRADNTHDLLVGLLQKTAATSPLLLILEDTHWFDSASWAMALLVSKRVQPVLLVVVTRPLDDPPPVEYSYLLTTPTVQRLVLDALPPEETLALVCERLGVKTLPEPLVTLIRERAGGNPFFSEELAYALRDARLITIANGMCQIAPGKEDLRTLAFPDTVQGVIASRIDRLTPPQQLALKVASIIGRLFAFRILRDVYPIESEKARLTDSLGALERFHLTLLDTPEPDLAYIFKHIITQEVAYNLMLFAHRRQLHRAVAEWYERTYANDLSPFYPLLVHHWGKAEVESKTLESLEKAGEQALRSGAYQETVRFFGDALTLEARTQAGASSPGEQFRQAHWEQQLAEGFFGLGDLPKCREHLQRALVLLGSPDATSRIGGVASVVRQILRRVVRRLWPSRWIGRPQERRPALLEGARAYLRLAEIHFFANEKVLTMNGALKALSLAEGAGPSPELAKAYANMCVAAALIPFHPLAEAYLKRAHETSQHVDLLPARAYAFFITSLYTSGIGQWGRFDESVGQAKELFDQLGDRLRSGECTAMLVQRHYWKAEFSESKKCAETMYAVALKTGNLQQQIRGLVRQAKNAFRQGRSDEAFTFLEMARPLLTRNTDQAEEILAYSVLAMVRLYRGERLLAEQETRAAIHVISQSDPTFCYALDGYVYTAEACLMLWETAQPQSAEQKTFARLTGQACNMLKRYSRIFPVGQPRACLFRGSAHWLAGRTTRAHWSWRRGLAAAQRLDMPYEEGLAHYEIGRHTDAQNPDRQTHLTRACEIFNRISAAYDLARAQAALKTP